MTDGNGRPINGSSTFQVDGAHAIGPSRSGERRYRRSRLLRAIRFQSPHRPEDRASTALTTAAPIVPKAVESTRIVGEPY